MKTFLSFLQFALALVLGVTFFFIYNNPLPLLGILILNSSLESEEFYEISMFKVFFIMSINDPFLYFGGDGPEG